MTDSNPIGTGQTKPIALVTGATRGIGHQVARQLAAAGAHVLAGARDPHPSAERFADLVSDAGSVELVRLDVTDQRSIDQLAARVKAGAGRLDILVNNAGIALDATRAPLEIDAQVLRRTYETNVFGVVAVTHAFIALLARSEAGRVVNVSSAMGSLAQWTNPDSDLAKFAPLALAYNSSKSALNAVTVMYALALRETPVKVNAADPGYVSTDLNGHRGSLTPEEGARVITSLATLPSDGPTGAFVGGAGAVPW